MAASSAQMPASDLGPEHFVALEQAILNVLSTRLAFETFAQVVDGIPTRDAYFEYYLPTPRPEYSQNLMPSDKAREIVWEYLRRFHVGGVTFPVDRAQAYQDASLVSGSFKLRMFELVAIACHNIAAELYTKAGGGLRKPASPPQPPPSSHPLIRPAPPNIAELFHDEYEEWRQYPNGVADVVGYWAEYRLFGGVVLFDRGTTGQECKSAYIHPIKGRKIFQLSAQQIEGFTGFALSKHPPNHLVSYDTRFFPERSAQRVDPVDSMALLIYRDVYERKPPAPGRRRCVLYPEDDPGLFDQIQRLASG
ncbi:hypothetical protein I7I53_01591 [Histoplasma capsulatum var. duboisii H88]|nr:hypothetical protein I7I53_01591 [Histoplasma capsulatum var. duboisii H88]